MQDFLNYTLHISILKLFAITTIKYQKTKQPITKCFYGVILLLYLSIFSMDLAIFIIKSELWIEL